MKPCPASIMPIDVPGKAGQHMAAQPFAGRERNREHQDAAGCRAARPAVHSRRRAPETARGRPAARRRRAASPRRICRPRPGRPRRATTSPARKKPKPHHQPTTAAARKRAPARLCRRAPSISQTATVIGMTISGQRSSGGRASAPLAPAHKRDQALRPAPGEDDPVGQGSDAHQPGSAGAAVSGAALAAGDGCAAA